LASAAAFQGDHGPALELIVADNGSSGETPAIAREFGAQLVQQPVPGAAAARNAGLAAATGHFIAFLDDDDVWLREHLLPRLRMLSARPDLAGVVGRARLADSELVAFGTPWPASLPSSGQCFGGFLPDMPQIGATVVRASVRETVEPFDETLMSDQDWDWHLRLAATHRIGFVPVTSVLWRQ
jgi:glycosyltransferase involved in cell wall biosynthesis